MKFLLLALVAVAWAQGTSFCASGGRFEAAYDWKVESIETEASVVCETSGHFLLASTVEDKVLLSRYLISGALDQSFGENGVVKTATGGVATTGNELYVQKDGKYLVVGTNQEARRKRDGVGPFTISVVRYLRDGALDTTFGDGKGYVHVGFRGMTEAGKRIESLPDGRIYAAAFSNDGTFEYISVIRLFPSGVLDSSYGNQGMARINIVDGSPHQMFARADGTVIVAGGRKVVSFDSEGKLNKQFGEDGFVTIQDTNSDIRGVCEHTTGNFIVLVAEQSGGNSTLVTFRYSSLGVLDEGYGVKGRNSIEFGENLKLLLDNPFVCGGNDQMLVSANVGNSKRVVVVKLLPSGDLDSSFSSNGIRELPTAYNVSYPVALAVQPLDHKIIAVQTISNEESRIGFELSRLLPSGKYDDDCTVALTTNQLTTAVPRTTLTTVLWTPTAITSGTTLPLPPTPHPIHAGSSIYIFVIVFGVLALGGGFALVYWAMRKRRLQREVQYTAQLDDVDDGGMMDFPEDNEDVFSDL